MSKDEDGERHWRDALEWMIALQERPDDAALHERFRLWRRTPAHDAAWKALNHVSAVIRQTPSSLGVRSAPPSHDRRSRRDRWTAGMLLAMAACLAALVIGPDLFPSIMADAATGTAEVRTMTLADGSRVTLAPRSAVAFDSARHARLLRGTAYFQVRHDDANPFLVVAGDAIATDLGTAFEVTRDGPATHIAVREGLVGASCLTGWRDPLPLRLGEAETIDCGSGTHRRTTVAPSRIAAWVEGNLVVTDRPLAEAIAMLQPWHRGWMIASGAGMSRHVTGVYDLRHPDQALAAMRQSHGLAITRITPWITIVHAD